MEKWASYGTIFAFLAFLQNFLNTFLPHELQGSLKRIGRKFFGYFSNYIDFNVTEYDGATVNELYSSVQLHLSESAATAAKRVNLALPKNATKLTYSLAENERMEDEYKGAKVWWEFSSHERKQQSFSWEAMPDEKRSLVLRIHKKDRDRILSSYVQHIIDHAKAIKRKSRDRLLYTNTKSPGGRSKMWDSVPFKHPSTFETLALDPERKQQIMDDLTEFAKGEEFYRKAGRAWKRGYLLYGPPGTGKSSMIAAIANFLEYDVYDLELTEVKANADLRKLLIKTSNKSIIVIEDIDCSLDLSDRAKKKAAKDKKTEEGGPPIPNNSENEGSQVTLSGLLNFTDGLWSCCGSERIIVFTTNHIEKLDPALLRSGRMDMHVHLSYCTYPAFKVLVKNYLEVEEHELFPEVEAIMGDVEMTPADVSEVLIKNKRDPTVAIRCLVESLKELKMKPKSATKTEEEEKGGASEEEAEEKREVMIVGEKQEGEKSGEAGKGVEEEGAKTGKDDNNKEKKKQEEHEKVEKVD